MRALGPVGREAWVVARRWVLDDELHVEVECGVRHVDREVDEGVVLAHEGLGHFRRVRRAALEGAQAGCRAVVVVTPRDRKGCARGGDDGGAVDAAPHGVKDARVGAQNVVRATAVQRADLVDADANERCDGGQAVELMASRRCRGCGASAAGVSPPDPAAMGFVLGSRDTWTAMGFVLGSRDTWTAMGFVLGSRDTWTAMGFVLGSRDTWTAMGFVLGSRDTWTAMGFVLGSRDTWTA